MAKRRKIGGVENQGFGGMDLSVNPQRMAGHVARIDKNGDHRWPQSWHPRPGLARGSLAKQTGIIRNVIWFKDRSGVERVFYFVNSTGKLEGTSKPTPGWNPPPINVGGPGFTFNPVTALTVSNPGGLTLTWTNPTSAFWVGTLIKRRTDCYPQGPNDPQATTVYNGRAATATDSTLTDGLTGYYSAFAYSKAMWAAPAKVSGVKGDALVSNGQYTTNGSTTWVSSSLPSGFTASSYFSIGTSFYCLGVHSSNYKISRSTTAGATFGAVGDAIVASSEAQPSIAVTAAGRILAAYSTSTSIRVKYSDDYGATWTTTAEIGTGGANGVGICVDSGGAVYVAYDDGLNTINIHSSADNGATFGAALSTINQGAGSIGRPPLAACGTNIIILCADGANLTARTSTDSGANWTTKLTSATGPNRIIASGTSALLARFSATAVTTWYTSDSGANIAAGDSFVIAGASTPNFPGIGRSTSYWYLPVGANIYRSTTISGFASLGAGSANGRFVTGR